MSVGPRLTAPLNSRRTFEELRAAGQRGASPLIKVRFLPASAGPPLVAYAISKRVGGAVVRNRIRRRLRAAVDHVSAELSPGAYLLTPEPSCRTAPFDQLTEALRRSVSAAGAVQERT